MLAVDWFLGRLFLQPLFERLHGVALAGMNYDRSWNVALSGELMALREIRARQGTEPSLVVDVGASIGDYTQAALDAFGSSCRVHAFEPSATAHRKLLARFSRETRVSAHNLALGSTDRSESTLYQETPGSATGSLHVRTGAVYPQHTERVFIRTLDAFCAERGIDRIALLKIDTEGHELQVLRGAKSLLQRNAISAIQFELSVSTVDARVYFRDFWQLLSADYDIFRIVKDGLRHIPAYRSRQEVFMTINYLALLRLPTAVSIGLPGSEAPT
jgi:FkbM family methyltransferase